MNLPTAILTIRWMVWDTFRQSLASRIFWLMMAISLLCTLFCLSIRVEGDERLPTSEGEDPMRLPLPTVIEYGRQKAPQATAFGILGGGAGLEVVAEPLGAQYARSEGLDSPGGWISLGFGLIRPALGRDRTDAVRWLEIILAGAVADTLGLFLVLIWTAGFLPGFLDPSQVTVLLAKPTPRWALVIGKFAGVVIFVGLQAIVFVGGTWLAIGISTGVFSMTYLLTIPLVMLHFAIFYSFSVLLAVWTRSPVVCVLGTLLFWLVCWGTNFARHEVLAHDVKEVSSGFALEAGYWVLPKPGDMSVLLFQMMKPQDVPNESMPVKEFATVLKKKILHPELSLLTSLMFSAVILGIAARELHTIDY